MLCEFTANTTNAMDLDAGTILTACKIHAENIATAVATIESLISINNLLYDNGNGINLRVFAATSIFIGNTFDGDGESGSIAIQNISASNLIFNLSNNLFFDLGIGVDGSSGSTEDYPVRGFNYFSSCTSNYQNSSDETTDIDDGTTDPFEDSAARDYTLANGSNAIAAGADAQAFSGSGSFIDIGALQKEAGAGSAGSSYLINGGLVR